MKNLTNKIFKGADSFVIKKASGEQAECRGVITRLSDNDYKERSFNQLGSLEIPLYLFMGTELDKNDVISGSEREFRVLKAEKIEAFGKIFCIRAVLEEVR